MIDSAPKPSSVFGGGASSSPSPLGGAGSFPQPTSAIGFGQNPNPINSSTFGSGVAQNLTATSPFGNTTPSFGQAASLGSNSVFGNRTSAVGTASPFSSSIFGQSAGSSTPSGSPFAQGFGQSAPQNASTPLFGSSSFGGTGSVFSASSQSTFGQTQAPSMTGFGAAQPSASFLNQASGFGMRSEDGPMSMTSTQPQQQTGFGGHPTGSLFGAKPDTSSNPNFRTFR